jgi:transaldolase
MATATQTQNPLAALQAMGQSVWLDYITRKMLIDGELKRLIDEDDLRGMTSNPTIFEKAISHGPEYDEEFQRLAQAGADADAIYRALTTSDIRAALEEFGRVYDRTAGRDGFVSLEVSPLLAYQTEPSLAEARALWRALDRPNAMIKIPGTPEGLPAIEEALFEGININVTLLFSVAAYEQVAHAYLRALKRRVAAGLPIDRIASVASFFVSRIDTETDQRLEAQLKREQDPSRKAELEELMGKAAIANAKHAYALYESIFFGPEFAALRDKGARVQRLLWASVSTKNPKYPDTLYVDELIGPDTVSTMPPQTFAAFKDHGKVRPSLTEDLAGAHRVMDRLAAVGIDFQDVTAVLLQEGVASFQKSFAQLMDTIRRKRAQLRGA